VTIGSGLWAQSATSVYGSPGNPLYLFEKATLAATAIADTGGFGVYPTGAVSTTYLWVWQEGQGSPVTSLDDYALTGGLLGGNSFSTAGCLATAGDGIGLVFASAPYDSTTGGPDACVVTATTPSGASQVTLASPTNPQPTVMTIDQANAYWFDASTNLLYASARDGSGYRALLKSMLAHAPVQLASDGTNLYWTDGTAGTVSSIATTASAGTPQSVATGQSGAAGIAVDATAIYWATSTALMKMIK
jgi:hypothetical protein